MKNPLLMIKDLLIEAASNIMKSQDADKQKTGIFRFVYWDHIGTYFCKHSLSKFYTFHFVLAEEKGITVLPIVKTR